jgi:phosphatidylglycerol:prolipoprotein diacylglycerol transferase
VYLKPKDFVLKRWEIATMVLAIMYMGLIGGNVLFRILHNGSDAGGFAYFGTLTFSLITIWVCAKIKKVKFLTLADYGLPFLLFSQMFVRIGCLLTGCCHGKPTGLPIGVIFKSVDNILRHPTQAYEACLLLTIFIVTRAKYEKKRPLVGYTFFTALMMYGIGRFFIEFLRVDSPVIFLNLTLAQYTCLTLALVAFIGKLLIKPQPL